MCNSRFSISILNVYIACHLLAVDRTARKGSSEKKMHDDESITHQRESILIPPVHPLPSELYWCLVPSEELEL